MANGAHALAFLDAPEATNDRHIELGEAMASAMALLAWGIEGFKDDRVPSKLKTAGGERLARLYHLRQAFDGADFDAVATREGKRAISIELQMCGIDPPELLLDLLAKEVLSAVHHVEVAMSH